VIECDPSASVEVLKVAIPLLRVPVPNVVLPSLKVTVPVAAEGETVAVKVTETPAADGFDDEVRVTVVVALFTVWVSAEDVLVL
jgi:hypothetical protein